jgi:hypothetical protein
LEGWGWEGRWRWALSFYLFTWLGSVLVYVECPEKYKGIDISVEGRAVRESRNTYSPLRLMGPTLCSQTSPRTLSLSSLSLALLSFVSLTWSQIESTGQRRTHFQF